MIFFKYAPKSIFQKDSCFLSAMSKPLRYEFVKENNQQQQIPKPKQHTQFSSTETLEPDPSQLPGTCTAARTPWAGEARRPGGSATDPGSSDNRGCRPEARGEGCGGHGCIPRAALAAARRAVHRGRCAAPSAPGTGAAPWSALQLVLAATLRGARSRQRPSACVERGGKIAFLTRGLRWRRLTKPLSCKSPKVCLKSKPNHCEHFLSALKRLVVEV